MTTKIQDSLTAIILAAGKGTRMGPSGKPKVLYKLAGRTMLERVLKCLKKLPLKHYCLVVGHNQPGFSHFLQEYQEVNVCLQKKQNGTAGAVAACAPFFKGVAPIPYAPGSLMRGKPIDSSGYILVCYGDAPLIEDSVLEEFITYSEAKSSKISVLGMEVPEPFGYGRLILDKKGALLEIIEEKEANSDQKKVTFCNSGILIAKATFLFELLRHLKNQNKQAEYYLTDIVRLARKKESIDVFITKRWKTLIGINTKEQLQEAENLLNC